MGIGAGIFLVAVGAILRFAVTAEIAGVSLDVVGTILMLAGAAVALLALLLVLTGRDDRTRVVIHEREDEYHRV